MRAGTLRDRVTFQRPVKVSDGAWGKKQSWQDFMTVWAEVTATGGTERSADKGVQASTSHAIRIRYTAGLTPEHRAIFKGQTFDIVSVIDPTNRRRELVIAAMRHVEAVASE